MAQLKKNLSKMNQTKNKIKGQTRKKVEFVSTELFELEVMGNPILQGEYYESLKASIEENGVLAPIIVDIDSREIISGYLRCLIALEVGCEYIPVVFEELELANKIIDFYKQSKFESPIYETYINKFVTDLKMALSQNSPEAEEAFLGIAYNINYLSMRGDNALYAFHDLLENIRINRFLELVQTGDLPSALHENNIHEFLTVVKGNFKNLNQESIQILRELAIAIFELCMFKDDAFDAFDKLLDNIYWARMADC